jgi:hypothetical protein
MNNLILFLVCDLCASFINAKESVDKKTALIDELIEVTNALDFATFSGDMVTINPKLQSRLIKVLQSEQIQLFYK